MKDIVAGLVAKEIGLSRKDVLDLIEVPPSDEFGDFAFPCFGLAKKMKKSPIVVAEELVKKFREKLPKGVVDVGSRGGYANFFVDKKMLVEKILARVSRYSGSRGLGKKIVIDYSHPNVAKHFGVHNLRSTLIGNSLYRILKFVGNDVWSVNHLGDWGTQFGKLIVAYKKWGGEINSVEDLNKLYVRFHDEAEKDDLLNELARVEFKKLEDSQLDNQRHQTGQGRENFKLWKKFCEISMKEFEEVYGILGIEFDEVRGESFFRDVSKVKNRLQGRKLLKMDEGANVVDVDGDFPPLIFEKSDEASTYASRDLGAIFSRLKKKPDSILYVVDVGQSLHFRQVFEVAKKLGVKAKLEHIKFGKMKFGDGKMSTRKGKVILFSDLLRKAEEKSLAMIKERSPKLKGKKIVARKVALAGIIFNDLKQDRVRDVVFDWDEVLRSEGRTGPYLLYSYARASSILRKVKLKKREEGVGSWELGEAEIRLVKKIGDFEGVVLKSADFRKPSFLAEYCFELASVFNEFYHSCPVLGSDSERFRLRLVEAFRGTLKKGLELLGVDVVEEM